MNLTAKLPKIVHLQTACDLLNSTSAVVMNRIDDGKLLFAWNISSRKNGGKREIRILTEAMFAFRENRPCQIQSVSEAVDSILPVAIPMKGLEIIRSTILQRRLRCSADLISDLVKTGEIQQAPWPVKPKKSPYLIWRSVSQFLHRRALGAISYAKARHENFIFGSVKQK